MLFIKDSEFDRVVSRMRNQMIARRYYHNGAVTRIHIDEKSYGYEITATVLVEGSLMRCYIETNRNSKIVAYDCGCIYCDEYSACAHIGAVILEVQNLQPDHFPYDYKSDFHEMYKRRMEEEKRRLEQFRQAREQEMRRSRETVTLQLANEMKESLALSFNANNEVHPRIECLFEPGAHSFRLKIGDERLYIIKSLSDLIHHFDHHETYRYGKQFLWRHDLNELDEGAQALIQCVKEHLKTNYGEYSWSINTQSLYINSESVDDIYRIASTYPELFVDFSTKKDRTPLQITVKQDEYDYIVTSNAFVGDYNELYFGKEGIYSISWDQLTAYRVDPKGALMRLINAMEEERTGLYVAKNQYQQFYRYVLEPLADYIELHYEDVTPMEDSEDLLEIYGDINADNYAVINVMGIYDDDKINLLAHPEQPCSANAELVVGYIRDQLKDEDKNYFYGDLNKSSTIDFLLKGLPFLQTYADVYVSEALKKVGTKAKVNVSVGISISNNLLELDIDSLDIPKEELAAVMNSYRKKKKYYRLRNGEMLHIESDELQELSDMMDQYHLSVNDIKDGHVSLNANRAYAVDVTADKMKHIEVKRNEAFQAIIDRLKNYTSQQYSLDERYNGILRDYQKDGYQWLSTMNELQFGGILADDMGLGKTLQMIAFLEQQPQHFSIVICPASLILNWQDELSKFSSSMKYVCVMGTVDERQAIIDHAREYDILITSYDYIRRDVKLYKSLEFDYIILDEAQYIKNQKTINAQSVKKLKGKHHFALTGTPIENSLAELWSLFDFINKDYLYNYTYFKKMYESPIVKDKDMKKSNELKEMISPFILRRRKADVLTELPDKIEQTVSIKFSDEQRKVYFAHLAEANQELQYLDGNRDRVEILAMLTRLRQICCEPRVLFDEFKEPSNKMKACLEIVESYQANGKKLLIFSSFKSMLGLLAHAFDERQISYYILTGDTTKMERRRMIKNFQEDDTTVFLISLKAGGTGINLTAAEGVIHFDPWWNMSAEMQATDRTHRIGQDKNVFVYKLIMKDSIEEKIQELQEEKKNLADTFVEGNAGQITTMTSDEIISLFK